jgi:Domain of unknown function (DUF4062)
MISSTARDLPEFRKATMDACLSLDVFPAMMEHLPASAASPVRASLRMVDEADLYIGIFGGRYGYIPEGTAASVTELEYRRAVERGIPILAFIVGEGSASPQSRESAEHAERLADLRRHLAASHVVNFVSSPDELLGAVLRSLAKTIFSDGRRVSETSLEEPRAFSRPIRDRFADLSRTIDQATALQYEILNFLRYQRRVAIAGCAGSGKTLLAAEKALRLDRAGLRTMIVCHSAPLAHYIRTLVSASGVIVHDFTSWVQQLRGAQTAAGAWHHYEEPTDTEITEALDALDAPENRVDAMVADEGQDFREEWWLLVEAALTSLEFGVLYVFHDDNQALLPFRSKYPLLRAPVPLSRNCRNAGNVFEFVRAFHPQAPEPSVELGSQGILRTVVYGAEDEQHVLSTVVGDALRAFAPEDVVMLTTEPPPAAASRFEGHELEVDLGPQWQDFVCSYLQSRGREPLQLSNSTRPTPADTRAVVQYARRHYPASWPRPERLTQTHRWGWQRTPGGVSLSGKMRMAFFTFESWANELPAAQRVVLMSGNSRQESSGETIRLATVSEFKGLEAPCVVLLVPSTRDDLETLVYVGGSRAVVALFVAAERRAARLVRALAS